jgi:DHA1 family tetracycline resistance protein-like MFS transporter
VLYAGYRYGWNETTVGLTLAFVGVSTAVVSGFVVGPTVKRLGTRHALLVGLAFGILGMTIYGLAPTGAWFWVGVPIMSLWGLVGPSLLDLMSRQVSESEQGQLQGANSSSRSITGLIGPAIFTTTFAGLLTWQPGAPFLLAALLLALAAAVTWMVTAPSPQ